MAQGDADKATLCLCATTDGQTKRQGQMSESKTESAGLPWLQQKQQATS